MSTRTAHAATAFLLGSSLVASGSGVAEDAPMTWRSLNQINRRLDVILGHHELAAGACGKAMQCCGKNTPTPRQD